MRKEQLSDAIGRLDEAILQETITARAVPVRRYWRGWVAVAACLCVLAGCLLTAPFWPQEERYEVSAPVVNSTVSTSVMSETESPTITTTTESSTTVTTTTTTESTTTSATTTTTTTTTQKSSTTTHTTTSRHPISTTERTLQTGLNNPTNPTGSTPLDEYVNTLNVPNLLMAPIYPKMVARPSEYDPEAEKLWEQSVQAQREQITGETTGMTHFYAATLKAFLTDDTKKNRVYSPLNVYLALAMLAETTEGNSRAQILDLLNVSDVSALREKCGNLWNGVYNDDGVVTSRLGNSLWLAEGDRWDYNVDTARVLAEHYYASTYKGVMGSDSYNKSVQNWLNEQTGGLLKEQASKVDFDADTALALASTVYFKANWYDEYREQNTYQRIFHTATGDVTADFMKDTSRHKAYFGEQFTAIFETFEDTDYKMWFILPDEGASVETVVEDPQLLEMLEAPYDNALEQGIFKVNKHIPKFDVTSEKSLIAGLQSLGVTDVFDSKVSDFSGILSGKGEPIAVSALQHAARVTIDEEGVEAAAFTVIVNSATSARPNKDEELEFIVDRPFMFAITGPENVLLFTGIVETPQ